jgi:DNA polymerase bacteriophage-type
VSSLSLDYETKSLIALPDTGPYVYAMHPSTDVWLAAWAFDDMAEPELWYPGQPCPPRVGAHILAGGEIRAHNAAFERLITKYVVSPRYGWPEPDLEQYVCSAAEAAAMSLPRALGALAKVLGVDAQKDSEGHNLMMRMCRPRSFLADGTPVWWNVPERIARLGAYCVDDVKAERACTGCLRRLTSREREIYILSEQINDLGIKIDRDLILAAADIAEEGVNRANALVSTLTAGEVTEVTKVSRLKAWLISEGVQTDSVDKDTVKELLEGELSPKVRSVLEQRAIAGRSSIAKLKSILECACTDDRVRGTMMYHGAGTGRWTGKLVQPHNFPRGEVDDIESFIPDVLERKYDVIDLFTPPVVVISSMLRSMLTAAPGKELIAGDYSAIEARVLNWLAGQDDIVRLFAEGKDVYSYNAARLFEIPLSEVKKQPHRQTGKFQELGCGFGMGHKKAVASANTAQYGYLVMSEPRAKEIVDGYRASHPRVVAYWAECNEAAMQAVSKPGAAVTAGPLQNVKFLCAGAYLYIVLPSGRPLVFPAPKIEDAMTPWGEMRPQVTFFGVHAPTNQWCQQRLYGGLIVENIVQAVARDLMAEGMLRARDRGYTPILDVHDEVVTEVPVGFGDVKEYEQLLCELPNWAQGCPVAAEGWRGFRYRK